ncbi:IclR family transcriptional regulator [Saccharopolyspora erythraea]|uniref:IclR family transcriptional regulator n=1 Tax=Saccharopolyspora erythraea TaxID=1836 RepID=UPI001BA47A70|nr:IclR family transcriptional regulator [Saccharopolyspora erythraea]QUH02034.1 IclR family transcriptional regulator [Saccharopolyspora erythraea]
MRRDLEERAVRPDAGANSVLGKVQLILDAFGPDDEHLSLTELSRRSGVAKASVHRLAQELLQWGVLERRGSDYWLGMRLFEIGQRVPRQRILREAARPYMEDLYHATNETIHLAVLDGLHVLYLEKVSGHGQVSRPSRVAGRMPLHCTATGKVFLAFGPPSLVDEVMATPFERLTPHTVAAPGILVQELTRARAAGYAVEHEQTRIGYLSVAIPLVGATGATMGALSVTAPVFRADVDKYAGLLAMVSRRVTKTITAMSSSGHS